MLHIPIGPGSVPKRGVQCFFVVNKLHQAFTTPAKLAEQIFELVYKPIAPPKSAPKSPKSAEIPPAPLGTPNNSKNQFYPPIADITA
jgi:hypothetical protein